ncbi:MAG: hypothetical protein AVDCRST_MAG01-01-2419 [uncultured Rubrobacteraceae bacterium]|uniref:Uncharacterized protein n=1 Tax=uncultured Rubrobacteraceae bacterium TaxID=349277 RepID=A0A6J4PT76_9ACTN|nr:MAG: hypothetical protein AVDCRST_MAG01-01-2419 [uncultured Rubrobacteraceae bacterium]
MARAGLKPARARGNADGTGNLATIRLYKNLRTWNLKTFMPLPASAPGWRTLPPS